MKKNCLLCGSLMEKGYNESKSYWLSKKYCSRKCSDNAKIGGHPSEEVRIRRNLSIKEHWKNHPELRQRIGRFHKEHPNSGMIKKGQRLSPETEFKIGQNVGEKGSGWRGGVTPKNQIIRHSNEYKLWRIAVFTRDDWTCQICNIKGGKLNADHIKPFAYFPELRFDINNGRTLCEGCHMKTDTFKQKQRGHIYA